MDKLERLHEPFLELETYIKYLDQEDTLELVYLYIFLSEQIKGINEILINKFGLLLDEIDSEPENIDDSANDGRITSEDIRAEVEGKLRIMAAQIELFIATNTDSMDSSIEIGKSLITLSEVVIYAMCETFLIESHSYSENAAWN